VGGTEKSRAARVTFTLGRPQPAVDRRFEDSTMVKTGVLLVFLSCAATFACADGDVKADGSGGSSGSSSDSIEIEGTWTASFLDMEIGDEVISDDAWTGFSTQTIVEFSNEENYAIWQNPDDAMYNPSMFGRNVWTEIEGDSFYYCTVAFMSETAEATADDAETADENDLETGCGAMSSPWNEMTRQ
jgi:hypothetical protein